IADIEPILDTAIFLKEGVVILNEEVDKVREERGDSLDNVFREMFAHTHGRNFGGNEPRTANGDKSEQDTRTEVK
ncbi:MAG: hypothetical protein FWG65_03085, partial [Turicibacter sp.]|nr:hypothetical protein [Turicibacter sp.]